MARGVPLILILLSVCNILATARVDNNAAASRRPSGAVVLFDGKSTAAWQHAPNRPCKWRVAGGALEVTPKQGGDLITREKFGDFTLHLEFNVPSMPDRKGQSRGNSGVKLHGLYEIQILDSVDNPTYPAGGCGAIYRVRDPDRNMSKAPLEWQTYDVDFRAPRLDSSGHVTENPVVTLVWNGVKVHDRVAVSGPTNSRTKADTLPETGPILLQDHGCPVRFRNIWIVPHSARRTLPLWHPLDLDPN